MTDDEKIRLIKALALLYKLWGTDISAGTWAEEVFDDAEKMETVGTYIRRVLGWELVEQMLSAKVKIKPQPYQHPAGMHIEDL